MDGLEHLAVAYGWPPSVGREMEPDEFADWVDRAGKWIKGRYGGGR